MGNDALIRIKDIIPLENLKIESVLENHFPYDTFPNQIQDWINQLNECNNAHKDITSCSILFAVSVALGTTNRVYIKTKWTDFANLYIAVVGVSGGGKSHPMEWALEPLWDKDKEYYAEYLSKLKEYKEYCKLSSDKKSKVEEIEEPTCKNVIAGTTTREALYRTLRENKRGIGTFDDELNDWINRLISSSGRNETPFHIKTHDNKTIKDRTLVNGTIRVDKPYHSILGGIQHHVVNKLLKRENIDSGFAQRWLYCVPVGLKAEDTSEDNLPEEVSNNYKNFIDYFLDFELNMDEFSNILPNEVRYDKDAFNFYKKWEKKHNERANLKGDEYLSIYQKIRGKFHVFALLYSAIYSYFDDKPLTTINYENSYRASQLCQYFLRNVLELMDVQIMNNVNSILKDQNSKDWYNSLPQEFKRGDIIGGEFISDASIDRYLKNYQIFKKKKYGMYLKLHPNV